MARITVTHDDLDAETPRHQLGVAHRARGPQDIARDRQPLPAIWTREAVGWDTLRFAPS